MTLSPRLVTVLAALMLATAACAPVAQEATRLSTHPDCVFSAGTCTDLQRTRASIW